MTHTTSLYAFPQFLKGTLSFLKITIAVTYSQGTIYHKKALAMTEPPPMVGQTSTKVGNGKRSLCEMKNVFGIF